MRQAHENKEAWTAELLKTFFPSTEAAKNIATEASSETNDTTRVSSEVA